LLQVSSVRDGSIVVLPAIIEADPEQSDGMIAAEIGVCGSTVRRLRKKMSASETEQRLGLDGKVYRMRVWPKRLTFKAR
jgi:hypothetical protein